MLRKSASAVEIMAIARIVPDFRSIKNNDLWTWRENELMKRGNPVKPLLPVAFSRPRPVWFRRLLLLDKMIERGYWRRVSGECVCKTCRRLYYDHRSYDGVLTLLCDGTLVKL